MILFGRKFKFHQFPEVATVLDRITLNPLNANWIRRPKESQRMTVESENNYKKMKILRKNMFTNTLNVLPLKDAPR